MLKRDLVSFLLYLIIETAVKGGRNLYHLLASRERGNGLKYSYACGIICCQHSHLIHTKNYLNDADNFPLRLIGLHFFVSCLDILPAKHFVNEQLERFILKLGQILLEFVA